MEMLAYVEIWYILVAYTFSKVSRLTYKYYGKYFVIDDLNLQILFGLDFPNLVIKRLLSHL